MVRDLIRWAIFLILALGVIGNITACAEQAASVTRVPQGATSVVLGTRELPTLYPTATPLPSPTPANTLTPQPSAVPATEIAFEQLVVDVTYAIPVLGLDRRIKGNVTGEIEVIDQNSGDSVTLKNRAGVIVELQQSLPRVTIDELPPDCDTCVRIEYNLPLTGQVGSGWLRDPQMLASLENYTVVVLGPHFPPGTVAGLRREATPFEVAHSAAITSDGLLWAWTATESQLTEPDIVEGLGEQAAGNLALIDWPALPESVGYLCYEGGGAESLQLDGPNEMRLVDVRCPEMYLPSQLVPVYSILSDAVAPRLKGSEVTPPVLPMSLNTMVLFRRDDGATLSLFQSGRLTAIDPSGVSYTLTMTSTEALSLTAALLDNDLLEPGPEAIFAEDPGNVILVRAHDAVYEVSWREQTAALSALVEPWSKLLENVLRTTGTQAGGTPVPTPNSTEG
jgi:hypothetical protein